MVLGQRPGSNHQFAGGKIPAAALKIFRLSVILIHSISQESFNESLSIPDAGPVVQSGIPIQGPKNVRFARFRMTQQAGKSRVQIPPGPQVKIKNVLCLGFVGC